MENTKMLETVMKLSRLLKRGHGPHQDGGRHHILRHLAKMEGCSPKELAKSLDVRPSSCTEMIHHLEKEGLVERKPNPDDLRSVSLYLTDKGREKAHPKMEEHPLTAKLNGALSEEEKEVFVKLAEKIIAACKEEENA